jgi:hypothetical protein
VFFDTKKTLDQESRRQSQENDVALNTWKKTQKYISKNVMKKNWKKRDFDA